jgi:hypothetical protein
LHPDLTMTGMYNVLEKLRGGEPLSAKEKTIHEQGLVSVLKQIHDDLDAAVFAAYGWSPELSDEEILEKLVALNAERAAEEARGMVRWLRPEFQNPGGKIADQQKELDLPADKVQKPKAAKVAKQPWPKDQSDRFMSLLTLFKQSDVPLGPDEAARRFTRARVADVETMLHKLEGLGIVREPETRKFTA